ncbi:MAG TPA: A24 family peptidase, partial [Gemmatimonadales bacterium]
RGWIGGEEIKETLGQDEEVTAMGGGDLKMMAMVGAFFGWRGVLLTIFLGALSGSLIYLPFLFREKKPLVPFGIYLALGAFVTLVAGGPLVQWYSHFLAQ